MLPFQWLVGQKWPKNTKNSHVAYIGWGGCRFMTWGTNIGLKYTPEGVFEATETIESISYVLGGELKF